MPAPSPLATTKYLNVEDLLYSDSNEDIHAEVSSRFEDSQTWAVFAEQLVKGNVGTDDLGDENREALAKFLLAVARVCENGVRVGKPMPDAWEDENGADRTGKDRLNPVENGNAVCGCVLSALKNAGESEFSHFVDNEVRKGTIIGNVVTETLTRAMAVSWHEDVSNRKSVRDLGRVVFDTLFDDVVRLLEEIPANKDGVRRLVILYCFLCVNLGELGDAIAGLLKKSKHLDIRKAKLLKCLLGIISGDVVGQEGGKSSGKNTPVGATEEDVSDEGAYKSTFKIPEYQDALAAIPPQCSDFTKNTCSYSHTGDDFTEQHWYNCYTCGLSWDKGCCNLCARICHKGHDVAYSRFSSFFCDCGEGSKALLGSSIKCSCLNPVSTSRMKTALASRGLKKGAPKKKVAIPTSAKLAVVASTKLAAAKPVQADESYYLRISAESKKRLTERALKEGWAKQVFEVFRKFFIDATAKETKADEDNTVIEGVKPTRLRGCSVGSVDEAGRGSETDVGMRAGKPLGLEERGARGVMYPVRVSSEGSFKLGLNNSYEPSVKALVDEYDLKANLLAFDSCGMAIVAENKDLAFSCSVSAVNVSAFAYPSWSRAPVSRTDLSVVNRHSVPFRIMGLKMNSVNESFLLVWGVNTLHLKVLNNTRTGVSKSVNICLEMDR